MEPPPAVAWTELDFLETDRIWADFTDRFRFRPSTDQFPGIAEPTPSVTFDLTGRADAQLLDAATLAAFAGVDSVYALDWQHPCYRFSPAAHAGTEWPVSVYPDGDYHVFLTDDLGAGTFGHPWERTLCVFGELLVATLAATLAGRLTVRRTS